MKNYTGATGPFVQNWNTDSKISSYGVMYNMFKCRRY